MSLSLTLRLQAGGNNSSHNRLIYLLGKLICKIWSQLPLQSHTAFSNPAVPTKKLTFILRYVVWSQRSDKEWILLVFSELFHLVSNSVFLFFKSKAVNIFRNGKSDFFKNALHLSVLVECLNLCQSVWFIARKYSSGTVLSAFIISLRLPFKK